MNQGIRDAISRAARGEFVRWDTPIYGRSGGTETIIIDASVMPVKDERGEVFLASEGRDITEKRAYELEIAREREELAQLDKLKTQFFANIKPRVPHTAHADDGPARRHCLCDLRFCHCVSRRCFVRAHGPCALRLRALTGMGQPDDRRKALEAGFDHHLVKPAQLDKVRELLSEVARNRSA